VKQKGFTLVEVLVAIIIVAIAFTSLLYLHTQAVEKFLRAKDRVRGVIAIENYLAGNEVQEVKCNSQTITVKGKKVIQEKCTYQKDPDVYFLLWKVTK